MLSFDITQARNVILAESTDLSLEKEVPWFYSAKSIEPSTRHSSIDSGCLVDDSADASDASTAVTPNEGESRESCASAYDFRSDFVTVPTQAMLKASMYPSLAEDWEQDQTTGALQKFMARLTGKEEALLVLCGTMGNQLALKAALGVPPHSLLVDHRGHIVTMEAGAVSSLTGTMVKPIIPSNGHHLTLRDIKQNAVLGTAVYDCPTRLISLENTLNGTVMPLQDLREIAEWAHAQDPPIHVHLDGARLWEAVASGAGSLSDYCQAVDTVSMCFTKGIGAPMGAIVVGSHELIKRARWVRKLMGGGMRQSAFIAGTALVAVHETFLGGKLKENHKKAQRISQMWMDRGGKLANPTETNMVFLDLDYSHLTQEEFVRVVNEGGVKAMMKGRLVVHHQICDDAINRLGPIFDKLIDISRARQQ